MSNYLDRLAVVTAQRDALLRTVVDLMVLDGPPDAPEEDERQACEEAVLRVLDAAPAEHVAAPVIGDAALLTKLAEHALAPWKGGRDRFPRHPKPNAHWFSTLHQLATLCQRQTGVDQ